MPKETPISYSRDMVLARRAGLKTMTRRFINIKFDWEVIGYIGREGVNHTFMVDTACGEAEAMIRCPYGQPGDTLRVREKIRHIDSKVVYDADGQIIPGIDWVWKRDFLPPMFCPERLSRSFDRITNITAERVGEISAEDAIMEGIPRCEIEEHEEYPFGCDCGCEVREFEILWDSINGKDKKKCLAADPYVWVIEYERITK